jgi:hypothetical protein
LNKFPGRRPDRLSAEGARKIFRAEGSPKTSAEGACGVIRADNELSTTARKTKDLAGSFRLGLQEIKKLTMNNHRELKNKEGKR